MDALILCYFFIFLVSLYFATNNFIKKIRNLPPSPFPSLPIIGHLYLLKKPLYRTLSKIAATHGPVIFLNFGYRPVLVVSSPSAAEECLTENDVVFANRPRLIAGKHFGYNYTSLLWAPYGDHWRNLRRLLSMEVFSSRRLHVSCGIRSREVQSTVKQIYKSGTKGDGDGTVNMKDKFFELTTNVMMRMIDGKRYYGDERSAEEVEETSKFHVMVIETFRLTGATNLCDFLPVLKWIDYGGIEKRIKQIQLKRDAFMQILIDQHRTQKAKDSYFNDEQPAVDNDKSTKNKTMIEVLLKLQETDPDYYTDQMIRSIILVLLIAGTDTSAGTMEWALSLLLNNPHVLKNAQSEIDNHVGNDRLIEESDLADLPYLHCIITETLRMYPVGPMLVPHESLGECTIGGYRVPSGTMLLINLWAIQNNAEIWEEPRVFRPERFEGLKDDRDGFKLMPFGYGRRGCPGEGLAGRLVGLALGSMIQCFEWERVGEEMVDMTEASGLTMPRAYPLVPKCKPRLAMIKLLSNI